MSLVSNVVLAVPFDDQENAEQFSAWLQEQEWGALASTSGAWGGYKGPECLLYAGTLNYGDLEAVVEKFGSVSWRQPKAAQLLLMDQGEAYFRLWMIRDGAVRQYAPTIPIEFDGDDDDRYYGGEDD